MLFLVQHGEAMTETENPERPLTIRGRSEVERVATWLARSRLSRPSEIWHSGKRRAQETAEIFAHALFLEQTIRSVQGLAPNDDVQPLIERVASAGRDLLIVGHLPFLSRLVSRLLIDREEPSLVHFRMGGVVGLERDGRRWVIGVVVPPDAVPDRL